MAFRRAAVTFFEGTSRLAAAAAIIIIGSAATAWAQSDCEATCPVPCMFGLCSAPIDVEPNACSEARSQSLFSVALSQDDCIGYEAFIAACPNTPEARLAEASLQRLSCGGEVEPTPAASSPSRAHGDAFKDCAQCPEMVALRGGVVHHGVA